MVNPVAPRNAATVVLARPGSDGVEIYMLRRSVKSPFMPSTLVFPGGRLDPEDGDPAHAQTWIRAAQRECREETGLKIPATLRWFDTWLTPSAEATRRYLARFFLATLAAGEGEEAEADGHETHAGRWANVAAHLAAWEAAEIDLPPPTICVLLQLAAWMNGSTDPLEAVGLGVDAVDPGEPILPKVTSIAGEVTIVMPHDDAYRAIAGEALSAPARVRSLPRRFVRARGGWRPQ